MLDRMMGTFEGWSGCPRFTQQQSSSSEDQEDNEQSDDSEIDDHERRTKFRGALHP